MRARAWWMSPAPCPPEIQILCSILSPVELPDLLPRSCGLGVYLVCLCSYELATPIYDALDFEDDDDDDNHVRDLTKLKPVTRPTRFAPAKPNPDQPFDLNEHLVVVDGRLGLVRVIKAKKSTATSPDFRYVPEWGDRYQGESKTLEEANLLFEDHLRPGTSLLFDLGYVGDFVREHAACSTLQRSVPSSLLAAVADPTKALPVPLFQGDQLAIPSDSAVPINEGQLEALQGLSKQVEAIQGPPGTGKSTTIFHIVKHLMADQDGITLASCVQNKAVDAIAEKLAGKGANDGQPLVPFIVAGNPDRIGIVAKRYTLEEQVMRDPEVVAANAAYAEQEIKCQAIIVRMVKVVSSIDRDLARSLKEQPRYDILASYAFEVADQVRSRNESAAREIEMFLEELFTASDPLEALLDRVEYAVTRAQQRIVASARVLLCTVASVGGVFNNPVLSPLLRSTKLAVLDEAGTSPESKLPLLLLLPKLLAIVALGDQNQLQPFSHCSSAGSASARSSPSRRSPGACFDMRKKGFCRFGSQCKFSHDPRELAQLGSSSDNLILMGFLQRIVQVLNAPMLTTQYRMHPKLCDVVSSCFYRGSLKTPLTLETLRRRQDSQGMWALYVKGSEGNPHGRSGEANLHEVERVLELYEAHHPGPVDSDPRSFLIITFYRAQERELRKRFKAAKHEESDIPGRGLRIVTVDKSQGSEADVVILSTVRSNDSGTIGFLSNPNRANVAISRARMRLIIVGNIKTLAGKNPSGLWANIFKGCQIVLSPGEIPNLSQRFPNN
eukprot:m.285716 g.285716  ORF g.285716 m.285716 type:complete len:782 (-) comp11430_c0_seq1:90-2435(-)